MRHVTSPRKFIRFEFATHESRKKPGANSYFSLLAIIPSPPHPLFSPFFLFFDAARIACGVSRPIIYIDIDRKRKQQAKYRHTSPHFSFFSSFHLSLFLLLLPPLFFSFKWTSFDSGSNRLSRRNTPLSRVSTIRTTKVGKGGRSWNPVERHSLFLATRAFAIIVSIGISWKY